MSKRGGVKIVLDELGLKTRIEVSRARSFVRGAIEEKGERLERAELKKLLTIYKMLVEMDTRRLSNIPTSTAIGLGHTLFLSLRKGSLRFVSFASPAYEQDFMGRHIDIGDGRDKKEYRAPAVISEKLRDLDLPYTYDVFFVDIDPEVVGRSREEVEVLFAKNFEGLCTVSGVEAKRLSQAVDASYLERLKGESRTSGRLAEQVSELQNRPTVLAAHHIKPEAIEDRAVIYAALGKLLEETAPETILLDIQGRIYPYEQPFYDTLRRFPLPLLRLAKM